MNYNDKTKKELVDELQVLNQKLESLQASIGKDYAVRKQIEFDLKERLKEINCHNRISKVMSNSKLSVDESIDEILAIMPNSWQFPEIAEVSIQIYDKVFKTLGFEKSHHSLFQEIKSNEKIIGQIEVCYPVDKLPFTNQLFLPEESDLLFSIAERLGNFIEKKEKEVALLESEKKYRNLIGNINDVLYEIDKNGIIRYISPSVKKILGFTPEQVIGKNFVDFVGENAEYLAKRFKELRENHDIQNEYRIINTSGETRWIRLSTKAIFEGDVFMGGSGTLIDITEKKLVELELQKSESLYRSILNASPDTIIISDLEGKILFTSPMALKMYGYEHPDVFLNHSILDFIDKKDHPKAQAAIMEMFQGQFSGATEYKGIRADGTTFDTDVNGEFIRDAEGNPTNMIFISRDISDRKAAEEGLRKLSRAVEQSPVSIVITNLDGNIEYANPQACKTTGYTFEELAGKNPRVLKSGETSPNDYIELWNSISRGNQWRGIFHNKKKSGELYWESSVITPIHDLNGNITHYLAIKEDITERILIEEKIRQQNERLNAIISALPDLIFVLDKDGNYLEQYSSNAQELLAPRDQLIGMNLKAIFNAETTNLHLQKINECIQQKKLITYEYSVSTNNSFSFFEVRLAPMGDDKVLRFVRDFTEEKLKNDEIKKLSLAVEQSPVSIVITDLNANIEYVNPAFEETYGYSSAEVIGQNTNILKSGETADSTYKHLWETITAGKEWQGEWINKKKNGELFWEHISIAPIHDEAGIITNYLAEKQDITQRKKAEKEIRDLNATLELRIEQRTAQLAETNKNLLKEIEERKQIEEALQLKTTELENFFNVALDLLCIANTSGNFIKVNKAWEDILGYSKEELEQRNFLEFIHPDDLQATITTMGELSEQNPIINFTNRYSTKDGGYRFIEWHSVPVGNLIYAAARDITERIETEDELRKARIEAEQANLAKSEFLSRMSHELRTPMNSILGFAQLLQMGELDKGQTKGVGHILHSGRHLLDLINEILDISRIEAGQLSLSLEPVQLNSIIQEMIDIVKPQTNDQQLMIQLLSPQNNQLFVKSDRQRLKQILLNLLNNAIKYNKTGGSVFISTEVMSKNLAGIVPVRISVTDTGMGISQDNIPKLFNPFERIGAETTTTEGTGLGLAVVKRLIDAMGGSFGVESVVGEGSTFWIELPQCESQLENIEKSGKIVDLESRLTHRTGTILYIEDNAFNVELIEQILSNQRSGIQLISNANGRETVNMAIEYRPNLILLDLNLPDIHGSEVLKLLQAEEKTKFIPVVIISADAMPHQINKLLKAGAKYFLTKPVDVFALLKVLDELITK